MNGNSIGFDLAGADQLVADIGATWQNLVLYEREAFLKVQDTLRKEWVGPDEQQFEQAFTMRLRHLYEMTEDTVSRTTTAISTYAANWAQWQVSSNKLEDLGIKEAGVSEEDAVDRFIAAAGKATPTIRLFVDLPYLLKTTGTAVSELATSIYGDVKNWVIKLAGNVGAGIDEYLTFIPREYEDNFRGLVNGASSATNCQKEVEEFVNGIKAKTQGLFDQINVNNAFYGDQTTNIKEYIDNASDCVAAVSTAVRDLNEALSKVAGTNYETQQTDAIQNIQAEQQNMQDTVQNSIANSKWD